MTGGRRYRSPRLWRRLLDGFLPPGIRGEAIRGDLEEEFVARLHPASGRDARRWYRRQVLGLLTRYCLRRSPLRTSPAAAEAKVPAWNGLTDDVRHSWRRLRHAPGISLITVATLAIGIGATTAVYSVINAVLLQPLPFPDPDRLVQVWETNPTVVAERKLPFEDAPVSPRAYQAYAAETELFSSLAYAVRYADNARITVGGGEGPTAVVGAMGVSASFFDVVGIQPVLGRRFADDEVAPPGSHGWTELAILTHELWARRYGADPDLLGKTIDLDGAPSTVIGVLPPGFQFPTVSRRGDTLSLDIDVYLPMFYSAYDHPWSRQFFVLGRLQPRASAETAELRLTDVANSLAAENPEAMEGWRPIVTPLPDLVTRDFGYELGIVLATAALVLLIASLDVANLLLVQGHHRRDEIALRAALGGSRWRLGRLLLVESAMLASCGGLVGLLLGWGGTRALVALLPADVPRLHEAVIDLPVLLFTACLSLGVGVAVGLLPVVRTTEPEGGPATVRAQAGVGRSSERHLRLSRLLVGTQVATSLVLLIGAGLMAKSFLRLHDRDPGYDPDNLLIARVRLGNHHPFFGVRMDDPARRERWDAAVRTLDRIRSLPGVVSAAAGKIPTDAPWADGIRVDADEDPESGTQVPTFQAEVSPNYFETLGIPILQGERFADWSAGDAERYWWTTDAEMCRRFPDTCKVLVSESFARRVWPGESPIGKRVAVWQCCDTVAGVVGDVRIRGVDAPTLNTAVDEAFRVYRPYMEFGPYLIRTDGRPEQWVEPVREAIQSLNPDVAVSFTTQRGELARSLARPRFYAAAGLLLAAIALPLAMVGLYGVIAYSVGRRTQEIGVRMALGADRGNVRAMVLRQGMAPVVVGAVVGSLATVVLARTLVSLLYGMSPLDPLVTGAGVLLVLCVAVVACYVPARRASALDPVRALLAD